MDSPMCSLHTEPSNARLADLPAPRALAPQDLMTLDATSDAELPAKTLADDLALDSLDRLQLVVFVEDEFGIEIAQAEERELVTVRDLVGLVEGKR